MKKLISLLLALIMLVPLGTAQQMQVLAQDSISVSEQQNPFFAGREIPSGSVEEYSVPASATKRLNGKTYYTRGKQLYGIISTQLQKRTSDFIVYYITKTQLTEELLTPLGDELYNGACDDYLASGATDGDYIRWSMSYWGIVARPVAVSEYYYYTLELHYEYYDTAAQENQVASAVSSFVNKVDKNSLSDYEVLKRVHDYICDSCTYDYDTANGTANSDDTAYSAYGALVRGKAVCQGYALAFYRICREFGYSCRIITSTYNTSLFTVSGHAWNLVQINGKYYYVDCTWDDNYIDSGYPSHRYKFFLVNYEHICANDDSKKHEHQPDEKYFDGEHYNTKYADNIDENDYISNDYSMLSNCVVSLGTKSYVYDGSAKRPVFTVTTPGGAVLNNDDFGVWYSSNVNTGIATAYVYRNDDGSFSSRRFMISPAKMGNVWLASGGRGDTYLTLQWTAAKGGVTGYFVEQYKNGKWTWVKTAYSTSAKITSLTPARANYFRIRAYKSTANGILYGAYSGSTTVCTKPKTPAVSKLKTSKKTVTASWKKIDASGYELQRSTLKNFKKGVKKYTVSSKTASKKITKLKKGTRYYFRIRAYKTIGGKKYYSSWSKTKSVKCK